MARHFHRVLVAVAALAGACLASAVQAGSMEGIGAVRVEQAVAGSSRLTDAKGYGRFGIDGGRVQTLPALIGVSKEVSLGGVAPYWRTLHGGKDGRAALVVGSFGLTPRGKTPSLSPIAPKRNDRGVIAAYNRPVGKGLLQLDASYIQQRRRLDGTQALDWSNAPRGHVDSYNLGATYRFSARYALSAGAFSTSGGFDPKLTDPRLKLHADRGTRGVLLKADWVPVGSLHFGLQYTAYAKFSRTGGFYGPEAPASANNTVSAFLRTAF